MPIKSKPMDTMLGVSSVLCPLRPVQNHHLVRSLGPQTAKRCWVRTALTACYRFAFWIQSKRFLIIRRGKWIAHGSLSELAKREMLPTSHWSHFSARRTCSSSSSKCEEPLLLRGVLTGFAAFEAEQWRLKVLGRRPKSGSHFECYTLTWIVHCVCTVCSSNW